MASDASWQTSGAGASRDAFSDDQSLDQRSVESLLRRLVERVEESERRYGEALDELHARLDQLSQTTEAARDTGTPQGTETLDHLQTEVSKLARRFEQDASTSLEDFERLGKALSSRLDRPLHETPSASFEHEPEPSPFAQAAMARSPHGQPPESAGPESAFPDFGYAAPRSEFSASPANPEPLADNGADLDKRLVELAQRLEESIGSAMPTSAIETMSMRLNEIAGQLNEVVGKAPTCEALEHIERQLSEISQQVSRAEEQLGKVGGIEAHLLKLIERLDEKAATPAVADTAQLEEVANKAAAEAARQVAAEAKQSSEKLDAMHRDISAMSDKNRESGDRLVNTLEAVHESLKQLVQQVERGAPAFQPKPKAPFLERARQAEAKPSQAQAKAPAPQSRPAMPQMAKSTEAQAKTGESAAAPKETLRDRLGAAIPDFKETETPPPFGRSNRLVPEEEAVDLDAAARTHAPAAQQTSSRKPAQPSDDDKAPEDLVAAARRAAQAAALRAEERGGRRRSKPAVSAAGAEQPGRRKRSVLIIAAAVLLILSAVLLYGRLQTKPATDVSPAPAEETTPAPADATEGEPQSGTEDAAPAADPDQSGWAPMPDTQISPPANVGQAATGFTEMAKSSGRMPDGELTPEPQLASLGPDGEATLPPGVLFSIEDPASATDATAPQAGTPFAAPVKLPMPPEALGPLALRQAAAEGDSRAQYAIAVRYAEGEGTKRDLKEAAKWFELAAGAGLAPAQYRLAAMYERGVGVDKDLGRARTWYAAAAEKGNVKAMHNLAVSVSGRNGGAPNYKLAAKWYAAAAAFGLADSQFNLGILAEHGLGMTKSLSEAYQWFSLAAEKGDTEAAKRRDVIGAQLPPETLAEAQAAVKAWEASEAPAEANEVVEETTWAAKASGTETASLVTRAQTLLNELGYDVGPPDGIAGSRTSTAIKLFQQRNGFPETGEVSDELVTKLEHLGS